MLGKLMLCMVSPDAKSHRMTVPVLSPPRACIVDQSTAMAKTLCPPVRVLVHFWAFKSHSLAVPSPDALSACMFGQSASIILTSSACASDAADAVLVVRSHICILPEAEPLTALLLDQSTATAHMTGTGSTCKSHSSSASSRLHNLRPPSLAPDKSCFSFMLFDPCATLSDAACVSPWSSSVVSFGKASPHQNSCKHAEGKPKCGSSLLFKDAIVSALLAERLMRDFPFIVLIVSSTGPVGTSGG
mmetsp:Transcript_20123/g.36417  ORF Transcript_20123/g.36417 Transcript_20123/m.36417 type:complete len:245 (-) Transcript_20123:771-1505(-)